MGDVAVRGSPGTNKEDAGSKETIFWRGFYAILAAYILAMSVIILFVSLVIVTVMLLIGDAFTDDGKLSFILLIPGGFFIFGSLTAWSGMWLRSKSGLPPGPQHLAARRR